MEQSIGPEVLSDRPAIVPVRNTLEGRYTALIPTQPEDAKPLYKHLGGEENAHLWTYLFQEPFLEYGKFEAHIANCSTSKDPLFFTVMSGPISDSTAEPLGFMTLMSIVPEHRRIEIGSICFGEKLKRTRQATETFYLLMKEAFDNLGYHRVEWKANNLNKPSLAAAERLGFVFEGIFRKHMIIKGRLRDTAWLSITDEEWPVVKGGLETWLSEENFDEQGKQRRTLKQCREDFQSGRI
ncbi:GNAT family [Colletotrichum truncatum]|uniref:GNAT family n=1 Tax=Colletotrichum truncatum TaxID=5467 RepID=A0ACC3YLK7_COLTU|nr:GNAT family [Colletotrichum truncatum]KAF6781846.1 GNAT family [Colletotrichum truncatum]